MSENKKVATALGRAVWLTATDTTIGFVSQDAAKLDAVKGRPSHKHYIKALPSLHTLQERMRIPPSHRKRVRRAKKTTFIHPNGDSFRIVRDTHHRLLLDRLGWIYTTSANKSGETYDEAFAKAAVDIIVAPLRNIGKPSNIFKLGKRRCKRIR